MKTIFDLTLNLLILIFIGILFVGFSIFLGKYELLSVALILVGASWLRSMIPMRFREAWECTPLVGEGLEIFKHLENHYLKYPARSIFHYLFYPITSLFVFFTGREADRSELSSYFYLIRWLVILLIFESATIYYELSQHFDLVFTLKWLYLELLCLYFLSNFFMVPLSTLSLKLSVAQRRIRLFTLCSVALALLVGLTLFFHRSGSFYQIIPMNIVLEQRFQDLESAPAQARSYHRSESAIKITSLTNDKGFFQQVECELVDLLMTYLPQWYEHTNHQSEAQRFIFLTQLNQRLQKRLQRLSVFDEHELFYLTLSAHKRALWGVVMVPFRESVLYFFKYERDQLTLYQRWDQLDARDAEYLSHHAWDSNQYELNSVKRLAQLVTQHVTKQVRLELHDDSPEESEAHKDTLPVPTSLERASEFGSEFASAPPRPSKATKKRLMKRKRTQKTNRAKIAHGFNARTRVTPPPEPHLTPYPFVAYHRDLKEFDYDRALTQHLLYDHQGTMPKLVQLWWTVVYEHFLSFLFYMFQLSMPVHIALILYCKVTFKSAQYRQGTV